MTVDSNVAVLVDGDNISKAYIAAILKIAESYGRADILRVYSDEQHLPQWRDCAPFRYVFVPGAKNAVDIAIAIDAADLSHAGNVNSFVLCSSDSDFCQVARFLRERGHQVVGCGEEKAAKGLRECCHDFHVLGKISEASKDRVIASELDQLIRKTISAHSTQGRGMALTALSAQLYRQHRVKISEHQEKTWRGYLSKRSSLYDLDPKGATAHVRFLPSGFA